MLAGLVLAGVLVAGALAAEARSATLRTATMLHGPVVRLSDLFDDAGANADRVLGTAPGPGGSIVVEAPQLAAIARQFGVDWRPASAAERAVLERAGRLLPRDDVLKAVTAALVAAGASPDCEVELPGFTAPMVPLDARPQALATELQYEAGSGRFNAVLSVTGEGMEPINLRVAGQVDDTIELPVAVARLGIGTVVRVDDVRLARVHVAMVHGEVLHSRDQRGRIAASARGRCRSAVRCCRRHASDDGTARLRRADATAIAWHFIARAGCRHGVGRDRRAHPGAEPVVARGG